MIIIRKNIGHLNAALLRATAIFPSKVLSTTASFTIDDQTSALTLYLTNFTDSAESWVAKPPIYHLQVKTTKGGLGDEFTVSSNKFERVSCIEISR